MSHGAFPAEPSATRFYQWLTLIALTYSLFVLYGSLVPLEPRSLGFAAAWYRFSQIRYLSLDVVARADWVANILLYIPLAFLWCAVLGDRSGKERRWGMTGLVLVCCLGMAVVIEFLQLWFPPRTVSQNDLLAEALGSVAGAVIWLAAGRRLIGLARTIALGGRPGLDAAITAYAGLYLAYSLMPFDFLVSGRELSAKLASQAIALIVAPACGGVLRCGVNLTLETAAFVPFGLYLALMLRRPGTVTPGIGTAILLGALAGCALEGIQIFIASGTTQGMSILTRAAGMAAGFVVGRAWSVTWLTAWLPLARGAVMVGALGYGVVLAAIAWRGGWQAEGAMHRLGALNWLPFYYHYYTTEHHALISLVRNAILYAPVGMAVWLWHFGGLHGRRIDLPGGTLAVWLGAALALLMEASRLLKPSGHADPTNILIGAVAAWLVFHLTAWFAGCLLGDADGRPAAPRRRFLR